MLKSNHSPTLLLLSCRREARGWNVFTQFKNFVSAFRNTNLNPFFIPILILANAIIHLAYAILIVAYAILILSNAILLLAYAILPVAYAIILLSNEISLLAYAIFIVEHAKTIVPYAMYLLVQQLISSLYL